MVTSPKQALVMYRIYLFINYDFCISVRMCNTCRYSKCIRNFRLNTQSVLKLNSKKMIHVAIKDKVLFNSAIVFILLHHYISRYGGHIDGVQNFNPVSIWVFYESQSFHFSYKNTK